MREIQEETNLDATLVGWLGEQVIQPPGGSNRKPQHAVYFLATAESSDGINEADTLLVAPGELLSTVTLHDLQATLRAAMPAIEDLAGPPS